MHLFVLLVIALLGYGAYNNWATKRAVAWNVVLAALTLRQMDDADRERVDEGLAPVLEAYGMQRRNYDESTRLVQLAVVSMLFYREGLMAPYPVRFRSLRSPLLVSGARAQIDAVRKRMEHKFGISLTELGAGTGTA